MCKNPCKYIYNLSLTNLIYYQVDGALFVFITEKMCSIYLLRTGIDSTNESNCGAFVSLLSAIRIILHHVIGKKRKKNLSISR
jgi:hypothetical protein